MTLPTNQEAVELAKRLTSDAREFLARVCDGRALGLADRREDKARQKCRRLGLVYVARNPRRWAPTTSGLAVRKILIEESRHAD